MSTILAALALVAAATPGLLVTPAELAAALKDPAVVVVTIANAPTDFETGHIPGARFIRYGDIAIDQPGLRSELPPVARLRDVIAAAGITDTSKVMIYGSPMPASRLFFTLDYLGHTQVKMLNGGLNAWKATGGAIEAGPARPAAGARLTTAVQPDRVVSADWLKERLSSPRMTLLDARPDAEFTGADGGMGMHVPGHLPGARQLVWNTLFDSSGKFLPDAELRKKFEAIGAAGGTPIVSYCMVGMRASVTYFVARHLGYDARMYDGSIEDWTLKKLPATTGK
jgi:thiosulfate/3-mercaptopyruvate sulfurtransferase